MVSTLYTSRASALASSPEVLCFQVSSSPFFGAYSGIWDGGRSCEAYERDVQDVKMDGTTANGLANFSHHPRVHPLVLHILSFTTATTNTTSALPPVMSNNLILFAFRPRSPLRPCTYPQRASPCWSSLSATPTHILRRRSTTRPLSFPSLASAGKSHRQDQTSRCYEGLV